MKKKIALALAAVMTMSSVATMSLFAATTATTSNNIVDYKDGAIVIDGALSDQIGTATLTSLVYNIEDKTNEKVANGGSGSDLIVNFDSSDSNATRSFVIELTGGNFYFYNSTNPVLATKASAIAGVDVTATFNKVGAGRFEMADGTAIPTGDLKGKTLRYFPNAAKNEIGYTIQLYSTGNTALITYNGSDVANGQKLRIPLVMKTTTDKELALKTINNNGSVPSKDYTLNVTGSGTTASVVGGKVKEGRDKVALPDVVIKENSINTFKNSGSATDPKGFTLEAPNGYKFDGTTPNKDGNVPQIGADSINITYASTAILADGTGAGSYKTLKAATGASNGVNDNSGTYAYFSESNTKVTFVFGTTTTKTANPAYVYVRNLTLVPEDKDDVDYKKELSLAVVNNDGGVTATTVAVAKFVTYGLAYSAADVKTIDAGIINYDEISKRLTIGEAAKVTVQEDVIDSWWTAKGTTLTLTDADGNTLDGVKIAQAKIKTDKSTDNISEATYENLYKVVGAKSEKISFSKDGHSLTVKDFPKVATSTDKVKLEVTFYLSPDVNFKGDVYAKIGGDAVPNANNANYVENAGIVKIATVEQKVVVDTKNTPVQIGYQKYKVADITITELKAGALAKDKTVELSIGAYNTVNAVNNILFVPITASNVTVTGDLKVSVQKYTSAARYITLTVDKASKTASSIKLSDLYLNIDFTVPNGTFELNVAGTAIRDNGDFDINGNAKTNADDYKQYTFANNGLVTENYVNVATKGTNTALTKEVIIYQNSASILIDGESQELNAPTINVDGRLFIPLRFVAQAFGAKENQDIIWDPGTGNVQITLNDRQVTWTNGSEYYVSGGIRMSMTEDGVVSKAFISSADDSTNGRTYIPFRYLGYAFGIPVEYDLATQAAIYNKTVNK